MASSSNAVPAVDVVSDQYQLAKTQALSLPMEELMRLIDEVQSEINRHASEEPQRLREEEERRKREEEEIDALFAAWLPHHFARSDRKGEERAERHQRGPRYGSATESDSEGGSDAGFEYRIEEVDISDESYDTAEEKRKMERYFDWKLRRRTFDEDLPDVSRDDEEEESSDDEESSSGDSDTSPASSGSSCSERVRKKSEDDKQGFNTTAFSMLTSSSLKFLMGNGVNDGGDKMDLVWCLNVISRVDV
ncbi:RNA polymerase II-associated factor 1 homolog [Papaver somniferum]|uniref:RNA polymerase II-associated factor 1 homolog n=1 Tax=Papaver somniferum TaxID=3469 RepID=UPI000E6F9A1E|nr:RNA polymerase II-associated factor 1 homolog [Papaver somniferum]